MSKVGIVSSISSCVVLSIALAFFGYLIYYWREYTKPPDEVISALGLGIVDEETGRVCPSGYTFYSGDCYKNCPSGYINKGNTCQISTCPPNTTDKGDYCTTNEITKLPVTAGEGDCPPDSFYNNGKCYQNCEPGFAPNGNMCKQQCPEGFTEENGTCTKPTVEGTGKSDPICGENEYKSGLLCYPKCKDGYTGVGPVCWQGPCPPNTTDVGVTCTKASHGRGVGTMPDCAPDADKDAGLCYNKCKAGYNGIGPVCWQTPCPPETIDSGVSCTKKSVGRGVGTVPTCPPGTYQSGALCYPNCRSGYYGVGPVCWQGPCPPNTTDSGVACTKNSYGRGAGTVPNTCPGGTMDGGLCYPNCNSGYYGVGPVCWRSCPSGFSDGGVFCGKPSSYGRGAGYTKQ